MQSAEISGIGINGNEIRHLSTMERYVIKWNLMKFTYFGYRVSAGGGCEVAMTARI